MLPTYKIAGLNYVLTQAIDLVMATRPMVIAVPVMELVALAIWLFNGLPVLFRQQRVGIRDKFFKLLKLRKLRSAADYNKMKRNCVAQLIGSNRHPCA